MSCTFWIATAPWAANAATTPMVRSSNGSTTVHDRAPEDDHAHDPIGREHGHAHDGVEAAELAGLVEEILGVRCGVRDLDGTPLEGHAAHERAAVRGERMVEQEPAIRLRPSYEHRRAEALALRHEQHPGIRAAELDGVPHDGLEHRREIDRRLAQRLEDAARRRLALDRLGEIAGEPLHTRVVRVAVRLGDVRGIHDDRRTARRPWHGRPSIHLTR
jgi:hypothetical protein